MSRPITMTTAAEAQLSLPPDQQFQAFPTPPLFLALSLLCTHGLAVALGEPDRIVANRHGLAATVSDDNSALVLRVVVFTVFPLIMSARLVRRARLASDRSTFWWNADRRQCVSVATMDGRYNAITPTTPPTAGRPPAPRDHASSPSASGVRPGRPLLPSSGWSPGTPLREAGR